MDRELDPKFSKILIHGGNPAIPLLGENIDRYITIVQYVILQIHIHVQYSIYRVRDAAHSLKLPPVPYIVCANSNDSGKTAQTDRLAWAFGIPIWASAWQNQQNDMCAQRRLRSARALAFHLKKAWVLSYPLSAQWRLWSDLADAQDDQSLCWAHRSLCWFCRAEAHLW